jgi:uncharacterized NAD(P)/FAD-binding protein YdhS
VTNHDGNDKTEASTMDADEQRVYIEDAHKARGMYLDRCAEWDDVVFSGADITNADIYAALDKMRSGVEEMEHYAGLTWNYITGSYENV